MDTITQIISSIARVALAAGILVGIGAAIAVLRQKKDLDRLIFIGLTVCISAYGLFTMLQLWRWALGLAVIALVLSIALLIFSIVQRRIINGIFTLFYSMVWLLLIFFSYSVLFE
jgi:energy-converting hydrogenase Eha subunit G